MCGRSSVGRALPSQGKCREFEPHRPLRAASIIKILEVILDTFEKSQSPVIEFENENVAVKAQKHPGCKVNLKISTRPIATKAAHAAAVRAISKEVDIPGFRKGKAPEYLVADRFSSHVEKEFKEIVARNALNEALNLTKFYPFSRDAEVILLKNEKVSDDSQLIEVEFDTFPEVPSVSKEAISIQKVAKEAVTEEKIQERIDQLKTYHSTWKTVDRAAEENDFVVLDIEIMNEDEGTAPFKIHDNSRFLIKEGKMPLWARNAVIGLKAGETGFGMSEPEENEQKEGYTPKKCKITVREVQEVTLPELNDELAKKAGVDTVAALRESMEKSIDKENAQIATHKMRKAVKEALLEAYNFELPASKMAKIHDECHKVANEDHPHLSHDEKHAYAHKLLNEAEKNARLSYLLPKIAKDHNISHPSPQEIQGRAREHYMSYIMRGEASQFGEKEIRYLTEMAENELFAEKVLDFFIENN